MLLSLSQWLQSQGPEFGFLRVFQYLTLRAVLSAMTALLIGLIAGPAVIRNLSRLKIGSRSEATAWRPILPRAARRRWGVC